MIHKLIRALRTNSSERFLLQNAAGADFAALDLHYLPDGKISGTLILFENAGVSESQIPTLLKEIDEDLLPDASIEEGNLSFTVVTGRVIGHFEPEATSGTSPGK